MGLELYNVRTRQKEPFVPKTPGRVGLYVCGLTVYDHVHIGHARTYTSFEVIRRWLEHRFGPGSVHHVMNVTDVDDRILQRAAEQGVSPRAYAHEWDLVTRGELERLGIRLPMGADYPHVTTSVPDIVRFIEAIAANGHAYATEAGNVYFDVPGYDAWAEEALRDAAGRPCGYGSLSNRDFKEMAAGTRKGVEGDKRHPADFALWKAAGPEDHPDANWDSPWGPGRPGWHIECSLMATRALGDSFDLHGGGQDLIFPHHENEIAQSQAKTGQAPFVDTWLHTGFLNVEGEKMSKSLGNFITLPDALAGLAQEGHGPAALRLYFLQTHYRSKIDYSRKALQEAAHALERLERTRRHLFTAAQATASPGSPGPASQPPADANPLSRTLVDAATHTTARVALAMDDDIHTPGALAALFDLQREANRALDTQTPAEPLAPAAARAALDALEGAGLLLTLFEAPLQAATAAGIPDALAAALQDLGIVPGSQQPPFADEGAALTAALAARAAARQARDWSRSDQIRSRLGAAGYLVEDAAGGQRWQKA